MTEGDRAQLERLKDWVGRSMETSARIEPRPVAQMEATLDHEVPPAKDGDALPYLYHTMFFNPVARWSEIGPDGHPARGGFLPPVPLPRRMFAGARLAFHRPLRVGETVTRRTEIGSVEVKEGRSGTLVFLLLKHRLSGAEGLALEEEHDIVYRGVAGAAVAKAEPAPAGTQWRREIRPDPVLLFRYSALTFNGHRIHYDRPYVTEVEHYPGLIVHGPLIATLLVDLVRRELPEARLASFAYRAMSPLFDIAPFTVNGAREGRELRLWAANPEGGLAMRATATLA
jgi:3-methylfumaryl-CoA hydratase